MRVDLSILLEVTRRHWIATVSPVLAYLLIWAVTHPFPTASNAPGPESASTARKAPHVSDKGTLSIAPVLISRSTPGRATIRTLHTPDYFKAFAAYLNTEDVYQSIYQHYASKHPAPLARKSFLITFAANTHQPGEIQCSVEVKGTGKNQNRLSHKTVMTQAALEIASGIYHIRFSPQPGPPLSSDTEKLAEIDSRLGETRHRLNTLENAHHIHNLPVQQAMAAGSSAYLNALLLSAQSGERRSQSRLQQILSDLGLKDFPRREIAALLKQENQMGQISNQLTEVDLDVQKIRLTATDPAQGQNPNGQQGVSTEAAMAGALRDALAQSRQQPPLAAYTPPPNENNIQDSSIQPVRGNGPSPPEPPNTPDPKLIPAIDITQTFSKPALPATMQILGDLARADARVRSNQTQTRLLKRALFRERARHQSLAALEIPMARLRDEKRALEAEQEHWENQVREDHLIATLEAQSTAIVMPEASSTLQEPVPHAAASSSKGESLPADGIPFSLGLFCALLMGAGCAMARELQYRRALLHGSLHESGPSRGTAQTKQPPEAKLRKAKPLPAKGKKLELPDIPWLRAVFDKGHKTRQRIEDPLALHLDTLAHPADFLARLNNPDGTLAQSFRALLQSLQPKAAKDSPKSNKLLTVVSGSSLIASGLAITLARQGNRVCLMEMTPDSSLLCHLFHLDLGMGLSDLVRNTITPEEILPLAREDSPVANLTVLARGTQPLDFAKQTRFLQALIPIVFKRFDRLILCMPDPAAQPGTELLLEALSPDVWLWLDQKTLSKKKLMRIAERLPQCHIHPIR